MISPPTSTFSTRHLRFSFSTLVVVTRPLFFSLIWSTAIRCQPFQAKMIQSICIFREDLGSLTHFFFLLLNVLQFSRTRKSSVFRFELMGLLFAIDSFIILPRSTVLSGNPVLTATPLKIFVKKLN